MTTLEAARYLKPSPTAGRLFVPQHEAYLAGLGHRRAAIADSRLLPLTELPLPI